MGFWTRKPIGDLLASTDPAAGHQFKRSLGVPSLTSFGVGGTIGAGIFVLTGTIAANDAGPAVVLSFGLASIVCLLAGLCYAELAAMLPVTGSAYSYTYVALGEGIAWIIGWNLLLEWVFSGSLVAIGWSGYVVASLADLGVTIPAALTVSPIDAPDGRSLVVTGGIINLPAVVITLVCTIVLVGGISASAWINNLIVAIKIAAIAVVIVFCFPYVTTAHWRPFIPPNSGESGAFGWTGVVRGAAVAFFSYIGFDGVSTLAQEAKNPQRTMPISLAASLAICTLLYVLACLVMTGVVDYHDLNVADPMYLVLDHAGPRLAWLKAPVGGAIIVGLVSVILLCLLGQVRVFYAMSRDGLIPRIFSTIHPRWGTPHYGTVITGCFAALAAGVLPLNLLGELISIGTLMAFATVCIAVIVLRRTMPNRERPFRTPWVPTLPLAGTAACLYLMVGLPPDTWIRLIVWLAVGLVIYGLYGVKHSRLRQSWTGANR